MNTSRTTPLFFVFAIVLLGCGPQQEPTEPAGWEGASLSDYEDLVRNTPENDSLPNEMKADFPYPPEHSELMAFQSPVQSQGQRGVCSIFSTVALMEHLYIKAGYEVLDFSEQYLQWSVKFKEGSFPHSGGSNAGANLRAIASYGLPLEDAWPYQVSKWTEMDDPDCAPVTCKTSSDCVGGLACDDGNCKLKTKCYTNGEPPQAALDAKKYFLPRGRYLNTKSIKNHIYFKKTGVVVGLDFFYQSWNHRKSPLKTNGDNWNQGYVLFPNEDDVTESHKMRAGHSILIVGWDDELEVETRDKEGNVILDADGEPVKEKGFYLFKNSWGNRSFGKDNAHAPGYGFISQKYVEVHGRGARMSDLPDSPDGVGPEQKSVEFTGIVAPSEMLFHSVDLGANASKIKVEMTGNNDADLYTRFGQNPTQVSFDCCPYASGSNEICEHHTPTDTTLKIGVFGYDTESSLYSIKVTWEVLPQ